MLSASKSHPKLNLISTAPSGKTAVRKANAFCDHRSVNKKPRETILEIEDVFLHTSCFFREFMNF